jgi:hypothetical protein
MGTCMHHRDGTVSGETIAWHRSEPSTQERDQPGPAAQGLRWQNSSVLCSRGLPLAQRWFPQPRVRGVAVSVV